MSEAGGETTLPTPLGAVVLTLGAWALLWFLFALIAPATGDTTLGLALGTTVGFGGVGTLAARAVPAPVEHRLGLRSAAPRWIAVALLLVPAAVVSSELDNWVARGLERPAPVAETAGPEAKEAAGDEAAEPREGSAEGGGLPGGRAPGPEGAEGSAAGGFPDWLTALAWALFAVLLRPVLEEFYFRGVVQQGMVAYLGLARGIGATALLFAAVRGSFGIGSAYALVSTSGQAFFEGLLLGLLRQASGSLLPGILLQAGMAGLGIGALLLADTVPVPGFNAEGGHTPLAVLAPCLAAVSVGAALAVGAARRAEATPAASAPPAATRPRPGPGGSR